VIFLNLSIDNNYRTQNKKPIGGNVMDQNGVTTSKRKKRKGLRQTQNEQEITGLLNHVRDLLFFFSFLSLQ
jgi:hypothetical protein